ncbi:MAG: TIR domain-containing protein [Desulfobacterales bacterium]|nr:TIR domain-containing protein [Desulfobacterales bacterium]
MGYHYPAFISYKTGLFSHWVINIFYPLFSDYLKEELAILEIKANKPYLCKYHDSYTGTIFPEDLKKAVARSICLIPVWSPSYFCSKWCMSELAVMLNRQRELLSIRKNKKKKHLIFPVIAKHGENIPEFPHTFRSFDCARYAGRYTDTSKYHEFEQEVEKFAKDVALAVFEAPSWKDEWLKDEWLDHAINEYPPQQYWTINQPILS